MKQLSIHLVRARRRGAGVGIVTAIFLLVVLGGLGVAMVTIFGNQRQSSLLDEQGARAYQAARAGIEWGLYHRLRATGAGCQAGSGTSGSATPFLLPANSVLSGFAVTVTCTRFSATDPAPRVPASLDPSVNLERWRITATACAPAAADNSCPAQSSNPDYVRRTVEVQL